MTIDKICGCCGTVNDAHHSAECIDTNGKGYKSPETPEGVVPLNDLLSSRTQDLPVAQPGEVNRPVLAIVQHWNTKGQRYAVLKAVGESDHNWQTVDDGSELSHDWNAISWIYYQI